MTLIIGLKGLQYSSLQAVKQLRFISCPPIFAHPFQKRNNSSLQKVLNLSNDYPSKTKILPERDLINFPRLDQNFYPPKVRLGIIPNSWFEYFYPKTGVTGSYLFLWGLVMTLMQKEIWVVETEFMTGVVFFNLQYIILKMYGYKIKEYFFDKVKDREQELKDLHKSQIDIYQQAIDSEMVLQKEAEAPKLVAQFKRDNVDLQLEANYRERLLMLHNAVKKRLDYNVEVVKVRKNFEHENMIDWVLRHVYQSITPQLEKEALNKCIIDLKTLAKTAPSM